MVGNDVDERSERKIRRSQTAKVAISTVIVVLLVVFALVNLQDVTVDWAVGESEVPLAAVLGGAFLLGALLGTFWDRRSD